MAESISDILQQAKQDRLTSYNLTDNLSCISFQKNSLKIVYTGGKLNVILYEFDLSLWTMNEIVLKVATWSKWPDWKLQMAEKSKNIFLEQFGTLEVDTHTDRMEAIKSRSKKKYMDDGPMALYYLLLGSKSVFFREFGLKEIERLYALEDNK